MSNIVLIGLSGSGKSSVGKILAKKLNMAFVDTDDMVISLVNKSIEDIFAKDGEEVFRSYEAICAIEASENDNTVISTGGGIILREENMKVLSKNGIVFFLNRSPDEIFKTVTLDNRPLVKNNKEKLQALYLERINLYQKYAMHTISNSKSAKNAVAKIIEIYNESLVGKL